MSAIIQIILVVVILAAMIMLLLGLDHLFVGRLDTDDSLTGELKKDVEKSKDVISDKNIFYMLVSKSKRHCIMRERVRGKTR